ncbi:MAG: ABC transporter permease [Deltaproteobacteria bacterium]|jgi:putative ABC transport system permease protein|nr:ABC transporter permease [Deltaproteobacteria bacterium]
MFFSMFMEAIRAMGANRLRTFLTMLGMVIGVGAVVLMLAVGEGTRITIKNQVDALGTNIFIVLAGFQNTGGVRSGSGQRHTLTALDAEAIRQMDDIVGATPVAISNLQLVAGGQNWNTQVNGVNEDFLVVRSWDVAEGRPMDYLDSQSASRVIWLGKSTAEELFGSTDPVGATIRVGMVPFTVAGVLASKGQSLDGRDQDDTAIVPFSTFNRFLETGHFQFMVRMIMVKARDGANMDQVEEDMRLLLRERHRLVDAMQDDDFFINNLSALMDSAEEMARAMTLLLGAIASVSLAVGGIGIMNIMLVSVTERTREIGIRLAIGARKKDILSQFLLEAMLVSFTGGFLGLLLGSLGASIVSFAIGMTVSVTPFSMILSFSVSLGIGIFFGFYPAWKAASQNPIEALHYQ